MPREGRGGQVRIDLTSDSCHASNATDDFIVCTAHQSEKEEEDGDRKREGERESERIF